MVDMPDIVCQRGHGTHATRPVDVTLGGPTSYHDYPDIPARMARKFTMQVFDWERYWDMDDPRYCPASDAVSQTIDQIGVWEPRETILTLAVCTAAAAGSVMVDMGAQLGWFSLLAASCGLDVNAVDADPENLRVLRESSERNGWELQVVRYLERIGPNNPTFDLEEKDCRVALAKIDIEGAENDAIRMLWPLIEAGRVDHLMIEVSPCFAGYYPQLVADLVDVGYQAWLLPPKRQPPYALDDLPGDLEPWRLDTLPRPDLMAMVASWRQNDCWFSLPGAPWE